MDGLRQLGTISNSNWYTWLCVCVPVVCILPSLFAPSVHSPEEKVQQRGLLGRGNKTVHTEREHTHTHTYTNNKHPVPVASTGSGGVFLRNGSADDISKVK